MVRYASRKATNRDMRRSKAEFGNTTAPLVVPVTRSRRKALDPPLLEAQNTLVEVASSVMDMQMATRLVLDAKAADAMLEPMSESCQELKPAAVYLDAPSIKESLRTAAR